VDEIQVTGRTGAPLYWVDAESIGTGITETENDFPVMRFVYNGPDGIGFVKLSLLHRYDSGTGNYNPLIELGAGTGVGENGKAEIEKKSDGLYITYVATGAGTLSAGTEVVFSLTDDGSTGGGGSSDPATINVNLNKTLALTDANTVQKVDSISSVTITVPPNASVAFPIDTEIAVIRYGEGNVSIAKGSGVTVNSPGTNLQLYGQYTTATLKKIGTDEWLLVGALKA